MILRNPHQCLFEQKNWLMQPPISAAWANLSNASHMTFNFQVILILRFCDFCFQLHLTILVCFHVVLALFDAGRPQTHLHPCMTQYKGCFAWVRWEGVSQGVWACPQRHPLAPSGGRHRAGQSKGHQDTRTPTMTMAWIQCQHATRTMNLVSHFLQTFCLTCFSVWALSSRPLDSVRSLSCLETVPPVYDYGHCSAATHMCLEH